MLHTYRESHITFLRSPILEAVPGVVHAFSTRRAGAADLSLDRESGEARNQFTAAVGLAGWPVCELKQVHSNQVLSVENNEFANSIREGDAAFTSLPGLVLSVLTADCVPILVAERGGRCVAAIHAGWRGASEWIARKAVDSMVRESGVDPSALVVAIGPHIGVCCMEVGEEVFDFFQDPTLFERRPHWPKPHLDLAEANRRQLIAAGVFSESIEVCRLCTRCRSDLFHSYRRDGSRAGRMLSVVGIETS